MAAVYEKIFEGIVVDTFAVFRVLLDQIAHGFSCRISCGCRSIPWLVVRFTPLKRVKTEVVDTELANKRSGKCELRTFLFLDMLLESGSPLAESYPVQQKHLVNKIVRFK